MSKDIFSAECPPERGTGTDSEESVHTAKPVLLVATLWVTAEPVLHT